VEWLSPFGLGTISCCPFCTMPDNVPLQTECCGSEPASTNPKGMLLFIRFLGVLWGRLSTGPNRRLCESLPGLLHGVITGWDVPLFANTDDCKYWLFRTLRGDCSTPSEVPKMSLLPPPGGFKTLQNVTHQRITSEETIFFTPLTYLLTYSVALQPWRAEGAVNTVP
jgi:hypothetical protein